MSWKEGVLWLKLARGRTLAVPQCVPRTTAPGNLLDMSISGPYLRPKGQRQRVGPRSLHFNKVPGDSDIHCGAGEPLAYMVHSSPTGPRAFALALPANLEALSPGHLHSSLCSPHSSLCTSGSFSFAPPLMNLFSKTITPLVTPSFPPPFVSLHSMGHQLTSMAFH